MDDLKDNFERCINTTILTHNKVIEHKYKKKGGEGESHLSTLWIMFLNDQLSDLVVG